VLLPAAALVVPATVAAQPSVVMSETGRPVDGLVIAADLDDGDEDGVRDGAQTDDLPRDGLTALRITPSAGGGSVTVSEGLRLVVRGRAVGQRVGLPRGRTTVVAVQGVGGASDRPGDRTVTAADERGSTRIPVTVVALRFRTAGGGVVDPREDAVAISHAVTNDRTLPRGDGPWDRPSGDPDDVQVELRDPRRAGPAAGAELTLESVSRRTGVRRDQRTRVPLVPSRERPGWLRSPWIRLVADPADARAPGIGDRVLVVGVRDRLRARVDAADGSDGDSPSQEVSVGRPGDEGGPLAARRGTLRVRVLRYVAGGPPSVGRDDSDATRLAREQVAIAGEIWAQCMVDFGDPADADVAVVDPPPPSLLAIGEDDGLPAAGGGAVRFRVDGRRTPPIETVAGDPPVATALRVADVLTRMGFRPAVSENARTTRGAAGSADVLVRRRDGSLAELAEDPDAPLGTDRRQTVEIGAVDLRDGLDDFDNLNASSGTLEERALLKGIADEDPRTVDLLIVNRFESGFRQGEAFIEGDGGAIINALILDRSGILQQRQAWTQSHELGHVLLDHPLHPDNVGPDRPWLLMDSDASLGTVEGPKRLTAGDCRRARARSGVDAIPTLLKPHPD